MTQEELNKKLLDAVCKNNINGMKEALSLGADANSADIDGDTALMYTCWWGYTGIIRLLLKHGADINITDKWGNTALIHACWNGYIDIVRLLIEHGADINIKNNEEQTALDILQRQYPNRYQKLIESTVIKIRREQLDTEDSLADPSPVDWDI